MEINWTIVICVAIIAGVILSLFGRRLNPARFFRAIFSPAWNNKILLGLVVAVGLFFFANAYFGGGKPLGLTAMQGVASEPTPKTDLERFYASSAQYFVTEPSAVKPAEPVKSASAWDGWLIWIILLIATIVFIPFAFWDEVRYTWHWAMERAEQRRVVINLRPPTPQAPQTPQAPGQTPQGQPVSRHSSSTWGQRFKEHFVAVLSAGTLIEFAEGLFRKILTDRVMRKIK